MKVNKKIVFYRPAGMGLLVFFIIWFVLGVQPGRAAKLSQSTTRLAATVTPVPLGVIEYVLDLSASMARPLPDGETIWDKTRASVNTYEDYMLGANLAFGLRAFGYPDLTCENQNVPNKPVVAPRLGSGPDIVEAMKAIVPNPSTNFGRSGILWAISKALEDVSTLDAAEGENRSIIVFTDGQENCLNGEQRQQAWLTDYLGKVEALKADGIRVKTYMLIIAPQEEDVCGLFNGHSDWIECISVSEVEASDMPGVVEEIRYETVFEGTPTPSLPTSTPTITLTPSPTITPTPTQTLIPTRFYAVPTGKPLPTMDRSLLTPVAAPSTQAVPQTFYMDPKILLLPIGVLVLIIAGAIWFVVRNFDSFKRR